jgi:hypothetical protein
MGIRVVNAGILHEYSRHNLPLKAKRKNHMEAELEAETRLPEAANHQTTIKNVNS